jgi:AraC-like DNA-binding protein
MAREPQLAGAIARTFHSLHSEEMRIVQQSTMDDLLGQLTRHSQWRKRLPSHLQSAAVAHRARDYLHAHMGENIGLSDLARETGTDRFTLTRCFKREFHLSPMPGLFNCGWPMPEACWRAANNRRRGGCAGLCRSKPSGTLVPAGISAIASPLPETLHKSSRRHP